ncbi:alpha-glucan family phosphorylase [Falsiroseomonas sp. HC035]|uniref:alpha-glucan family phosphorylase n=1 Tax=Falsiroseomonas sp. HC035 TaxID=3390999 RepID=UPI003D31528D
MPPLDRFVARTRIAYLSMEMALDPAIPTYAGGLGVLAGDTARSCADLELPVVFVTLASREGYFRQEIAADGTQVEHAEPWDLAAHATPLDAMAAIRLEGRQVWVRPWLYPLACPHGGCVPIILLDTRLEQNDPRDRTITDRLYGGDVAMRLKQEAVLGIGGEHLLRALGFEIVTWHMNEGHAALLPLSLLRRYRRATGDQPLEGPLLYDLDPVRERCIFTTHTPVEAGHDRFPYDLVAEVLGDFFEPDQLRLLAGPDHLNMTRLALSMSAWVNGVAMRHAETARRMFPDYRIRAITNGVHAPTWAHPAFARLYDGVAPGWAHDPDLLLRADALSDEAIRAARATAKAALLQEVERGTGIRLRPDLPILAYARRMTGYKRPELLFTDLAQLRSIAARTPFQILIGGKAHPRDTAGRKLIAEIHAAIRALDGAVPAAFLPGYDLGLARIMVAGADIWLNTPLPPLEASGTSGMKAALNGGLNLSVLDGWWAEACEEGVTGWAIGGPSGPAEHDAEALYAKLGGTVLPLWHGDQRRWSWMMKQAVARIGSRFHSQRMMRRYAAEAYLR